MQNAITLDGVSIKCPHHFKIERYNITIANRVASGKMTMELVAKKRKFYFTYDSISATELNTILDVIWEGTKIFFTLTYVENNTAKNAIVYVGAIPSELYRTDISDWVWTGVTFDLIEQ